MFDKIIAYSIRHKFVIGLFVFALIASGMYSLNKLPIDALPDITNNQVQILTTSPNLATQEVELFITYPIELAVKSVPRIVELRSVSRFGLSIVTVVFDEDADIYWARAQITERLKAAEDEIPEEFGRPVLAPISTGLGEIYQYTVKAKPGFEDTFDIMDLRSIQDWIIVPQLLGTKGVAEVNTLGGVLKEYEVAVNPEKLHSMNITMTEIFEALSHNNENTGGAYIDKRPNAYFIRSIGMVSSLEDVRKIVVKNTHNTPVLIRDVANVKFGSAVRYGATTKDGEGEVVNGMVMMLKGENSAEIIKLVKEKMVQIGHTLPEGIDVTAYLDRSKLVGRAISTVRTNLIEGALIVIFILVLLIGNWRAGLIVATVIPLSLLFAVSMMRFFGVSGNLMSLGAIDFGLIVDGAVIIVEAIVHRLQSNPVTKRLSAKEMDLQVYTAASKIRNSAAFGEIIILIVYLPILALVGIEGKMFRPMAQTVSFAILGAFILSLTYIPMMSALFLDKTTGYRKTISDRIISSVQRVYTPLLRGAMNAKVLVLACALGLFVGALCLFNLMGGEFIPTLSEGDIATHVIIPPGSSLSQEIQTTTKAEQMLRDEFPEIEQVVSKIGSAEVPTDPMPMEVADVIIILKDKKEWTSASTRQEMIDKMEKVLDDLPGVTTEFSQPIQMRFNELMTGIRSDVGVKIFGEDIELLVALGDQVESIINGVNGVKDCRAEAVSGLPQIVIRYDKDKLALYGLHVGDLNQTVSAGFAGKKAGTVYEGEEKYDLVIRLEESYRQDISNVQNLYVTLPSGGQIPLEQVADIRYERGPAQISREDGKRRIIVGFNVRGRDVKSVVNEIQTKLDEAITLPVGYYFTYAGQFENLERANKRLAIAVPLAMILIFILLFFTFKSIKQSIMIFTAIPLSAIGGVLALWIRDMPFSISAGVGFIALFGVAVLNGIVLISYFNQLKEEGMNDVIQRIKLGTEVRLRPVIMTAAVASLGFLPMALSTSAGAEVQKPLATVVIGGLLTATLLTLIILPILYYYSERGLKLKSGVVKTASAILIVICSVCAMNAQSIRPITLDQAIKTALEANQELHVSRMRVTEYEQLRRAPYKIPKTTFEASFGQLNTRSIDQSYSISQSFNPFLFKAKKSLAEANVNRASSYYDHAVQETTFEIRDIWDRLNHNRALMDLLESQQKIWSRFSKYSATKFEVGETNLLEKTTAEVKLGEIDQRLKSTNAQFEKLRLHLMMLLNAGEDIAPVHEEYTPLEWNGEIINSDKNSAIRMAKSDVEIAKSKWKISVSEKKPDLKLGYFIQSIQGNQEVDGTIVNYDGSPRFQGVNVGFSVPVFGKSYKMQSAANKTHILTEEARLEQMRLQLQIEIQTTELEILTLKSELDYYQNLGILNADRMVSNAQQAYEAGEIGYLEYVQALDVQFDVRAAFLNATMAFNREVHRFMFLQNR